MIRPSTRDLARQLLAAARAERPPKALGRRLLLLAPRALEAPRPRVLKRHLAAWLMGIAVPAAAVVALRILSGGGTENLRISREQGRALPSVAPVHPRAPAPATRAGGDRSQPTTEVVADQPQPPVAKTRANARRGSSREAPASVTPAPEAAPAARAAPAPKAKLGMSEEIELLTKVRASIRSGDGARALEMLSQHELTNPDSTLHAEAELLKIEALATTGRSGEAAERALEFVADNPHSALADRARAFLPKAASESGKERDPSGAP